MKNFHVMVEIMLLFFMYLLSLNEINYKAAEFSVEIRCGENASVD